MDKLQKFKKSRLTHIRKTPQKKCYTTLKPAADDADAENHIASITRRYSLNAVYRSQYRLSLRRLRLSRRNSIVN